MIESNLFGIDNGAMLLILVYAIAIPVYAYVKTRKQQ